jgi:hypothetical protein
VDRSSGLIGGGITPFSKEPYVRLSVLTLCFSSSVDSSVVGYSSELSTGV